MSRGIQSRPADVSRREYRHGYPHAVRVVSSKTFMSTRLNIYSEKATTAATLADEVTGIQDVVDESHGLVDGVWYADA